MKIIHSFNTVNVSLLDALKILCIKFRLRFRRVFRRFLILFRLNSGAVYLIPFWIIFIYIAFVIENKIDANIDFLNVVSDLKGDIFTSFIIVILSNTMVGIKKHKITLKKQYDYYNRLYLLIDDFFFDIYYETKRKKGPYFALDSQQRFDNFYEKLGNDVNKLDKKVVNKNVKAIRRLLSEIKNDEYYNEFYVENDFIVEKNVSDFRRYIDVLLSNKTNIEWTEQLYTLFQLVDEMGYIWRVDLPLRIKIDELLHKKYSLSHYDDKFLYEIFFNSDVDKNPFQPLIDSFLPPYNIIHHRGKKYIIRVREKN